MFKLRLGVLLVGLAAVSLAACGADADQAGSFITGDLNGETVRAEMTSACGTEGVADGQIWASVEEASPGRGWTLYVNNSVGTTDCPLAYVQLADNFGDGPPYLVSNVDGAICNVTVTAAAPAIGDFLEGTFTATVPASTSARILAGQVTNGAFRVKRDRQ